MRPSQGTAHALPEAYVTRGWHCTPATTDIWLNHLDTQPLFSVTAPANHDLIAMLRCLILLDVRRLVAGRRITVVFDLEG